MEKGHYQKGLIGVCLIDSSYMEIEPIGINLGFYGCAEHNRGIVELSKKFGIQPQHGKFGFEARKITTLPTGLHFGILPDNSSYLVLDRRLSKKDEYQKGQMIEVDVSPEEKQERLETILNHRLTPLKDKTGLSTAWDNHRFAIHASNGTYGKIMNAIYDAFLQHDIVISDKGPLVRGLGIIIYSRIPQQIKRMLIDEEILKN